MSNEQKAIKLENFLEVFGHMLKDEEEPSTKVETPALILRSS
jgi:hypothetical protein